MSRRRLCLNFKVRITFIFVPRVCTSNIAERDITSESLNAGYMESRNETWSFLKEAGVFFGSKL